MYISRERLVTAALCILPALIEEPVEPTGAARGEVRETDVAAFRAFAAEFLESGYKLGGSIGVDPARFLLLAID